MKVVIAIRQIVCSSIAPAFSQEGFVGGTAVVITVRIQQLL